MNEHFAYAEVERWAVVFWRGRVTAEAIESVQRRSLRLLDRYPDGIALFALVHGSAKLPDGRARSAILSMTEQLVSRGAVGVATYVGGDGLQRDAFLAIGRALSRFSRRYEKRFFDDQREAVEWMTRLLGSRVSTETMGAPQVLSEVTRFREGYDAYLDGRAGSGDPDETSGACPADLIARIEDLPVLPGIVARLTSLDPNADTYFDEVERLVASEPTYAARLLHAAAAVEASGLEPTRSVHGAMVRLGARRVCSLVVSMSVLRTFAPRSEWEKSLWVHAVQVASAAKRLAELAGDPAVDPEEAYVAGLLHDIGRILMFEVAPDELRRVEQSEWSDARSLIAAERSIVGLDHAELGASACARWGLPTRLVSIVRHHHDAAWSARLGRGLTRTGQLVAAADKAMFGSVDGGASLTEASDEEGLQRLTEALPPWCGLGGAQTLNELRIIEADAAAVADLLGV